jgi:2-C-methyl-D-erythritol 4-phosphate cytidylyltransferase/2-C-methyl-D-erythritol 2,4-cyclodiphosphate synthase
MTTCGASREPRLFALVACAGVGARAGSAMPKQYATLAGRPLVAHTLGALQQVRRLQGVLLVIAPQDEWFDDAMRGEAVDARWVARCGGDSRAASVAAGLSALRERGAIDDDWVLVHDAARCLVEPAWVERLIEACIGDAVGGLLALPIGDTLKCARDDRVSATIDRSDKWAAQTPQMFRLGMLQQALAKAGSAVTDEASAIEALGFQPRLVMGDPSNLKITWPQDFDRASALLLARERSNTTGEKTMPDRGLRFGEGWDIHALVPGRPLVLGGLTIPHSHGLEAHSDGDALLHAITDALFGAAALGDIGRHFPDTDATFKNADSHRLLAEAARRVRAAGYEIVNVDSTIVAQAPKLAPYIAAMCARIAEALGVAVGQVNVKAKTAEKMGPVGEGKAVEARAVALLARA